jgi:hypothetical protein
MVDLRKIKNKLMKELKKTGELSSETLENLEDSFHVDLSNLYGEDTIQGINKIIAKIRRVI